jgi:hypothetical protein
MRPPPPIPKGPSELQLGRRPPDARPPAPPPPGFKHDAHPMAIMVGVVGALSAFYASTSEVHDPSQQLRACMRLISKMPTLAALAYKTSRGGRAAGRAGGRGQGCSPRKRGGGFVCARRAARPLGGAAAFA